MLEQTPGRSRQKWKCKNAHPSGNRLVVGATFMTHQAASCSTVHGKTCTQNSLSNPVCCAMSSIGQQNGPQQLPSVPFCTTVGNARDGQCGSTTPVRGGAAAAARKPAQWALKRPEGAMTAHRVNPRASGVLL